MPPGPNWLQGFWFGGTRGTLMGDISTSGAPDHADLIDRLRAGDGSAFEFLVRAFAPLAMRVALQILGNEADAADAVQDTFISVMHALNGFRADCRLETWFHRIATNAALMKMRSKSRRKERGLDNLTPRFYEDGHRIGPRPAWTPTPDRILEQVEGRRFVHEKISQLPKDFRNVLILRDIQQESTAETAKQLGVSQAVVKTRLHRARQALRGLLEEELAVA